MVQEDEEDEEDSVEYSEWADILRYRLQLINFTLLLIGEVSTARGLHALAWAYTFHEKRSEFFAEV